MVHTRLAFDGFETLDIRTDETNVFARVWAKRVPRVHARSFAVLEACDGCRHGDGDEQAWIRQLRRRRARQRRPRRLQIGARSTRSGVTPCGSRRATRCGRMGASLQRIAAGYWPWSLLAQPYPLPECLIAAAPEALGGDRGAVRVELAGDGLPAGAQACDGAGRFDPGQVRLTPVAVPTRFANLGLAARAVR